MSDWCERFAFQISSSSRHHCSLSVSQTYSTVTSEVCFFHTENSSRPLLRSRSPHWMSHCTLGALEPHYLSSDSLIVAFKRFCSSLSRTSPRLSPGPSTPARFCLSEVPSSWLGHGLCLPRASVSLSFFLASTHGWTARPCWRVGVWTSASAVGFPWSRTSPSAFAEDQASRSSRARCNVDDSSASWFVDARTHALIRSVASALSLVSASPSIMLVSPQQRVTSIRLRHSRMIAMSMAQRLSSISVGAPGLATKSNTLLQSMTLWHRIAVRTSLCFFVTECWEQKSGKKAHDPFQVLQVWAQCFGITGQWWCITLFQLLRLPHLRRPWRHFSGSHRRVGCSNDVSNLCPFSSVLIFRRVVSACPSNPRVSPSNLSNRGTRHALLCQTHLAAEIWPCLSSQPVALLRRRQVVVGLKRRGKVVCFCVASRLGWFHLCRICFRALWKNQAAVWTRSLWIFRCPRSISWKETWHATVWSKARCTWIWPPAHRLAFWSREAGGASQTVIPLPPDVPPWRTCIQMCTIRNWLCELLELTSRPSCTWRGTEDRLSA